MSQLLFEDPWILAATPTLFTSQVNNDAGNIGSPCSIDKDAFWAAHRNQLPVHYAVYLGDCATKKGASANVETIFSGAKQLTDAANRLCDPNLEAYVKNHNNWQYEWLRPSIHDIVCAYYTAHGPGQSNSVESGSSSESE